MRGGWDNRGLFTAIEKEKTAKKGRFVDASIRIFSF